MKVEQGDDGWRYVMQVVVLKWLMEVQRQWKMLQGSRIPIAHGRTDPERTVAIPKSRLLSFTGM
jgi:hypothetical protein